MTVRRLYVPQPLGAGGVIPLNPDQAHYLVNVLRMGAGDTVSLFNADSGEWAGTLEAGGKKLAVQVKLIQQTKSSFQPPASSLVLCFAPLKKTRTDFLVEKASELGVHVLQPIITDYTNSERVKVERLQQIAIKAAEQCDRLDVPEVREPMTLEKLLESLVNGDAANFPFSLLGGGCPEGVGEDFSATKDTPHPALTRHLLPKREKGVPNGCAIFLAAERGDAQPIATALQNIPPQPNAIFIIGPEGGFSDTEFQLFDQYPDIIRLRLGPRLLRAETAAITTLGIYQGMNGDFVLNA